MGPAVMIPMPQHLRKTTVAPYIIFYRVTEKDLQIVRVLRASRDLASVLGAT
ncbi:MAG: type II toxin-antitoxin system RelE/ParE family toxin [Rhizobiales bacterium]|nr:type II toxin-antitoxin system RelE/ParE family toxin [Hyphomicrobiales bacterium]